MDIKDFISGGIKLKTHMTQQEIDKYFEERNLVFKDLCGRIPYHVRVQLDDNKFPDPFGAHHLEHFWGYTIVKPYLFPLSSMTEEQKEFIKNKFCYDWDINDHPYSLWAHCIDIGDVDELIDWFHKNHFDYRGLIPMGLAIDATELNIY